jgi:hypothetical protein
MIWLLVYISPSPSSFGWCLFFFSLLQTYTIRQKYVTYNCNEEKKRDQLQLQLHTDGRGDTKSQTCAFSRMQSGIISQ